MDTCSISTEVDLAVRRKPPEPLPPLFCRIILRAFVLTALSTSAGAGWVLVDWSAVVDAAEPAESPAGAWQRQRQSALEHDRGLPSATVWILSPRRSRSSPTLADPGTKSTAFQTAPSDDSWADCSFRAACCSVSSWSLMTFFSSSSSAPRCPSTDSTRRPTSRRRSTRSRRAGRASTARRQSSPYSWSTRRSRLASSESSWRRSASAVERICWRIVWTSSEHDVRASRSRCRRSASVAVRQHCSLSDFSYLDTSRQRLSS